LDLPEAYLEAMNRLVRIVLTVAALAIGWAPVARANAVADLLASGAPAIHHGQLAAHASHPVGHRHGHHGAPAEDAAKTGMLHPNHCPACIAVPPLPGVPFAVDAIAEAMAPSPAFLALWRGAPEPPPPRA
jgi:hypothetical protein